jgi:hypothetical protein
MKWYSSDTLSPLHENNNAAASDPSASSVSSTSSSYAKNSGKPHRQQDEFGSTQQLLGGGAKRNNIGSIWDRPKEMISKSNKSSSKYKPSDYGCHPLTTEEREGVLGTVAMAGEAIMLRIPGEVDLSSNSGDAPRSPPTPRWTRRMKN